MAHANSLADGANLESGTVYGDRPFGVIQEENRDFKELGIPYPIFNNGRMMLILLCKVFVTIEEMC